MAVHSNTEALFKILLCYLSPQCLVLHATNSWHLVNFLVNKQTSNEKIYPHKNTKIVFIFIHGSNKQLSACFTEIEGGGFPGRLPLPEIIPLEIFKEYCLFIAHGRENIVVNRGV